MTIAASSITSPGRMNFAVSKTEAAKTLAGMLSKTFIADSAEIVPAAASGTVSTELGSLKADLLNKHYTVSLLRELVPEALSVLWEAGVNSPYDKTAGAAVAKLITTADANALYYFLPVGSISKPTFNADIAVLKTGLASGQGFAELAQIL